MKTRKLTLVLATMLLASAAFVSSCKKKTTTDTKDTDTSAASDNSLAESSSNDAIKMAGQASENGALSSYKLGNEASILSTCAIIIYDSTANKTITVNFGTTPCLCQDGHYRSGTVKFDYSGSTLGAKFYRHPGFKCVVTTPNNDYYVDANKVTFSKTIINTTALGFNPTTTNMTWSVNGSVTIVKANNGGTINWSCNRTITLMNTVATTYNGQSILASYTGQSTPIDWLHALFSVGGSANGTSANGTAYSFSTTSPLVVNMNCVPSGSPAGHHPIVQGSFDFTPSGKATRHVDFGNGSCDNTFVVTINGVSYTITIN